MQGVFSLRGYGSRAVRWFEELPFAHKLALSVGFAALIGAAAQARIPVPWSPVPITGQTFAVLLAGVLLGRGWGGFSAGVYVAAGAAGLPWFAGLSGGLAVLAGPTGGYLAGFVLAAMAVGHAVRRYAWARTLPGLIAVMTAGNFILIHGPGLAVLSLYTGVTDLVKLLWMGTIPFIPGDLTKILAAAAAAWPFLPLEKGAASQDG